MIPRSQIQSALPPPIPIPEKIAQDNFAIHVFYSPVFRVKSYLDIKLQNGGIPGLFFLI